MKKLAVSACLFLVVFGSAAYSVSPDFEVPGFLNVKGVVTIESQLSVPGGIKVTGGTIEATYFKGDGSQLQSIEATVIGSGAVSADSIAAAAVTTSKIAPDISINTTGVVTATALSGDGAAVSNVNATQLNSQAASYYTNATNLSSGTLPDARLSTQVVTLDGAQTLTNKTINASNNTITNVNAAQLNSQAASYYTNATNLSSGTLSDDRLSTNVVTLDGAQTLTNKTINATNNTISNVNATQLNSQAASYYTNATNLSSGTLSDDRLSTNVVTLDGAQTLTNKTINASSNTITNVNATQLNSQAASYYTNATNLSSGTLSDDRLSTQVVTLDGAQTLTNKTINASNNTITNVNATQLNSQAASYYTNATNLSSGTLSDDRLSTNVVTLDGAQTLTNKTLTSPTIGNFTNAGHSHQNAAGAGTLDTVAIGSGTLGLARGGLGTDTSAAAQGSVLYHNGTSWVALGPGNSGEFLKTNGTSANPAWAASAGSGTVTSVGFGTGLSASSNPITTTGIISIDSTVVTLDGAQTLTNKTINASNNTITNVNATQLNSQAASYYTDATNLSSGTLPDARLSTQVVTLDGAQSLANKTLTSAGNISQTGATTITTGTGGLTSVSGNLNISATGTDISIAANKNLTMADGTGAITAGTGGLTSSSGNLILNATGTDVSITSGKNLTMAGASTFTTGTGTVTLNGSTTVATGQTLQVTDNGALRVGASNAAIVSKNTTQLLIDTGTGTGNTTITMNVTFAVAPIVIIMPTATTGGNTNPFVSAISTTQFTTNNITGTFNWIAIGQK